MKVNVYNIRGGIKGQIDLPEPFTFAYRPDLIKKVILAIQSNGRQPYGAYKYAGTRRVGHNWGPNHGRSRIPRRPDGDRGVLLGNMVGGRTAHAPRSNRNWSKKINKKENLLAKFSALSQTANKDAVRSRGHKFNEEITFPIIVENEIENVATTKQAVEILNSLGLYEDVERSKDRQNIRAGKGKLRGRKYKTPKSILLVVKSRSSSLKSFENLSGLEIVSVDHLNTYNLAPGGNAGRLTVYTEDAIDTIARWKL
ncbi:MAG: 50S ribosomal protein L4 [Thermoplasmata archaeon]